MTTLFNSNNDNVKEHNIINTFTFVGLFGIYQTVHVSRNLVLLAFSSFEDRTIQNVDAHVEQRSTNRKIASDSNLPLVGYASHHLNLAVNDLINFSSTLVNQIHTIVYMMRTYKNCGKLAKVISLKLILDNATRWMSVMKMIKRCKVLIHHVTQTNGFSATNESINLDDVRAYFNLLIEECPGLESQLGKKAPIIHDPIFEKAVIKVLRKQETVLTTDELQRSAN
ncbi:8332_t:CDS:2 [Ambispora gerdemannii]|uniref:8332_t:CDS:1 n=1 Tax=Ambispora gerdemannii TaxID=144530 RepID=A0A9N9AVF1_9GLOM|nr:8332_t:CDS:2 [Ambispora gerdemannii]